MGFLDDRKRKKEAATHQAALVAAAEVHAAWKGEVTQLQQTIAACLNYRDLVDEAAGGTAIIPKKGEEIIFTLRGAGLVESRRSAGQYVGGSQGVSFRVAKGVSYRVGAQKGTYQPGPEVPVVIDNGVFVVTNQRGVFVGSKQNREFAWSKLVSVNREWTPNGQAQVIYLPVSNRQKVSGICATPDIAARIHPRIEFGVALHHDRGDEFIGRLRGDLTELMRIEPPAGAVR